MILKNIHATGERHRGAGILPAAHIKAEYASNGAPCVRGGGQNARATFLKSLTLFAALLLIGCGNNFKTYYVLTPDGPVPSGSGVGLGVGPVTLAEYIDRPNLVIAQTANQLGVSENHRWAGDLAAAITRVTAANLGRRLGTGNVRTYPWQGDEGIRHQITLDIRQLHGADDGYAVIEAGWRAYSLPDRKLIASRTFTDREPLEKDGHQPLVAAESRLLSRLADDIAKGLK